MPVAISQLEFCGLANAAEDTRALAHLLLRLRAENSIQVRSGVAMTLAALCSTSSTPRAASMASCTHALTRSRSCTSDEIRDKVTTAGALELLCELLSSRDTLETNDPELKYSGQLHAIWALTNISLARTYRIYRYRNSQMPTRFTPD